MSKRRAPTEGPIREWSYACGDCGESFTHVGVRGTRSRRCLACRVLRRAERMKHYHLGPYKERSLANQARYRREQPELTRMRDRRNREKHRETRLEQKRQWDATHREQIREYDAKWRAAHPYERWAQSHRRWAAIRSVEREDYGGLAAIYERDGGRCAWCGRVVITGTLRSEPLQATLDHVAPLSAGGPDVEWNVVLACRSCNCSKRDRHFDEVLSA